MNETCAPSMPLERPASVFALFVGFNRLALQGFGGVLAVAQRELVEHRRWLTREDFLELVSAAQVLPGPNVVNLALMLGDRFFGLRGALAALAGMLLVPLAIVMAMAMFYAGHAHSVHVAGALRGMSAVASGLILATAIRLLPGMARNPLGRRWCAALLLATVVMVAGLQWPLVWVIPGLGSLAVALAWRRLRP